MSQHTLSNRWTEWWETEGRRGLGWVLENDGWLNVIKKERRDWLRCKGRLELKRVRGQESPCMRQRDKLSSDGLFRFLFCIFVCCWFLQIQQVKLYITDLISQWKLRLIQLSDLHVNPCFTQVELLCFISVSYCGMQIIIVAYEWAYSQIQTLVRAKWIVTAVLVFSIQPIMQVPPSCWTVW